MDKDALLNIILSDLGEIETMVKSFRGQGEIPKAFIELTEKKMANLMDEFVLLKDLNNSNPLELKVQEPKFNIPDPSTQTNSSVTSFTEKTAAPEPLPAELLPNHSEEPNLPMENQRVEKSSPTEAKQMDNLEAPATENVMSKDNVAVIVEAKTEANIKTIGESFGGDKNSVNDFMAKNQQPNNKKSFIGKPISDLTKGLGINDRFMFQRELFAGKAEVMNQTLQQINQLPDLNSALSFLKSNFDWDQEQEAAKAFLSYIERKF